MNNTLYCSRHCSRWTIPAVLFTWTIFYFILFFRQRKEKLGLGFLKKKMLGLRFLLWYYVRILEKRFLYYYLCGQCPKYICITITW